MKKLCLSLGAMLLSGVVLASCSNGLSIKKPNKGKAVDSISVDVYNGEKLEIKKDDKFKDVIEKLADQYSIDFKATSNNNYEFAYKHIIKNESKENYTNYVTGNYVYKKASMSTKNYNTIEGYGKYNASESNESISQESYYYNTRKTSISGSGDDYSFKASSSSVEAYGGDYNTNRNGDRRLDFASYNMNKVTGTSKSKTQSDTTKENESIYKYVSASEKPNDPDYEKTYRGKDSDGNIYSYALRYVFQSCDYANVSLSDYIIYSSYFEDNNVGEYSFELTDKYIILKSSVKLSLDSINSVNYYDYDSSDDYYAELKKISEGDYKGSKSDAEVWINYSTDFYDSSNNEKMLTISYANVKEITKLNEKKTLDDNYFENKSCSEELVKDYKGKEYTVKLTSTREETIAASTDKYDKKIDSFRKKAKKNNVYAKINMTYDKEED